MIIFATLTMCAKSRRFGPEIAASVIDVSGEGMSTVWGVEDFLFIEALCEMYPVFYNIDGDDMSEVDIIPSMLHFVRCCIRP